MVALTTPSIPAKLSILNWVVAERITGSEAGSILEPSSFNSLKY
jgi:hypothetical protein